MVKPDNITPILGYHKIGSGWEVGITTVSRRHFKQQMAWLAANAPGCPVTFDDGYESFYTHALPVLEDHGIKSTVFIIAGSVGKENTWDVNFLGRRFRHLDAGQIREIAALGHSVESHTVTHRDLTMLSGREVRRELADSKNCLEDLTDLPVDSISYPFGRTNERVADLALEAGYTRGYGIRYTALGEMGIGRRMVYVTDSRKSFARKATSRVMTHDDRINAFINRCAAGTPLLKQKIMPLFRDKPEHKETGEVPWQNMSVLKH